MRTFRYIAVFMTVFLNIAIAQEAIPEFSARCYLGENADAYRVTVVHSDRNSSTVRFRKNNGNDRQTFSVPGTLDGFQVSGPDLLLTFVSPGPVTYVYSAVKGHVKTLVTCRSRFGAETVPDLSGGTAIACLQGASFRIDEIVPATADIYIRNSEEYILVRRVSFESIAVSATDSKKK